MFNENGYKAMRKYENLKAEDFVKKLSEDKNYVILDVRSKSEYEYEHIEGAIHIPFTEKDVYLKLDKTKVYYLYCRIGARSAIAANFMMFGGFDHVYNLNDEIAKVFDLIPKSQVCHQ